MTILRYSVSMSLDGFVAGPDARQYLAAGLIDDFEIHLVPVFLGEGARLFDDPNLSGTTLEQVRAIEAPGVTHLSYRVVR